MSQPRSSGRAEKREKARKPGPAARPGRAKKREKARKPEPPPRVQVPRLSLTHVGGRVEVQGDDPELLSLLESALDVARESPETRAHVHGFHSYPARLHPLTAERLVLGLSEPGDTVLDPFAGSGTVLVEARRLGRRAIGTDVNPLAVDLAYLKARGSTVEERDALVFEAHRVAQGAEERRVEKAGPTKKYGPEDRKIFDVHMLLELDGLSHGIRSAPAGFVRETLKLVLSAILVKVSRKPGDTADSVGPRRLASGFAIRLFAAKAEELAARLEEYGAMCARPSPPLQVEVDDARVLDTVTSRTVDLVVTSPPYPGIYDYVEHHAVRLRWLGIDAQAFARSEMGSRRQLSTLTREEAVTRFRDDFRRALSAMRRVLRPGGSAAVVLADSAIRGSALYADDEIPHLARLAGLSLRMIASQGRPHFHEESRDAFTRRPRREHVFLLESPRGGSRAP